MNFKLFSLRGLKIFHVYLWNLEKKKLFRLSVGKTFLQIFVERIFWEFSEIYTNIVKLAEYLKAANL